MSARNIIIAVDGPAASGKGTLSRRLATQYNLAYLDTGLIYRAVGRAVLDAGTNPGDAVAATKIAEAMQPDALERDGLRTEETGAAASEVAAGPGVRAALLDFQRRFAATPPGGTQPYSLSPMQSMWPSGRAMMEKSQPALASTNGPGRPAGGAWSLPLLPKNVMLRSALSTRECNSPQATLSTSPAMAGGVACPWWL